MSPAVFGPKESARGKEVLNKGAFTCADHTTAFSIP